MDIKKEIRKIALENALKYEGKASSGAVIGKTLAIFPKKKATEIIKIVHELVAEINTLSKEEQEKEFSSYAIKKERKREEKKTLPELPQAKKGKVIMRLAPYPSGPLHLGNAKPYIINDEYVKKYEGKLLLVIDDTIGSKEKEITKEAYALIPQDLAWLKIKFDKKIYYKSDILPIYYKYAKELIKKEKAYACFCSAETLRENRKKGVACACREFSREKNVAEFTKMTQNKYKEGKVSLRLKTDIKHKNPAFRDRVLFRISERAHPRTKKKFTCWPLLEFSWAIDDHLLEITHIIRGKELMMESEMEKFIWDIFQWKHPQILHTALLQIEGIKLSKTKSRHEVISGKYQGWSDPRTWSLLSLKRRGFQVEAIRNFILNFGLNQNEVSVSVEALYAENKKIIEKTANRYFFIENPKKVFIANAPSLTSEAPLHPDFTERGYRLLKTGKEFYVQDHLEKGKMYRFMHLFNFKDHAFLSEGHNPGLGAKLIHWLPAIQEVVHTEVVMPDGSIKKGIGEPSLKKLKIGTTIQFERFAFCIYDKREKNKYIFYYTHR